MSQILKVGLVGTGRIGQLHASTIVQRIPTAQLVAVTDVNQTAAEAVASQHNVPHVTATYEDLLNTDIDAVLICSSTDTHAPFMIKAAQAGKHIFCEKPIAADLPTIDNALQAVDASGVKLMIGFNRRFDANALRIKQAISAGEIGTPHLLHIISRDPAPPPIEYVKVSGGLFFDMTIHDFDMARYLFGDVDEVYAAATNLVDPAIGQAGDVDTALITLKFTNGAMGVIDNSRQAVYGYDQRLEVFGSAGSAASGNLYPDAVTLSTADNVRQGLPYHFFMDRYVPAYQTELSAFVRCVLDDTPSPVNGTDGRAPVVIAQAAMVSLRENRPVKLSEIDG